MEKVSLVDNPPVQIDVSVPVQLDNNASLSTYAFLNQPDDSIDHIVFYAMSEDAPVEFPISLVFLGTDKDGADGWSVPVDAALLYPLGTSRILAMAELQDSQTIWGQSEPFASPQSHLIVAPALSSQYPESVSLLTMPLDDTGKAALVATRYDESPPAASPLSVQHVIGAVGEGISRLWRSGYWTSLQLTNVLSDGEYGLSARVTEADVDAVGSDSQHPLIVQRDVIPRVTILAPKAFSAVSSPFEVAVEIDDPDSTIERVDAYMYRETAYCPGMSTETPYPADMMWLGTDSGAVDGWTITARIPEHWYGDGWRIVVVAADSHGVVGWTESTQPFAILGDRQSRLIIASPLQGSVVTGETLVQALAISSSENVANVELYLRDGAGIGLYAGSMIQDADIWKLEYDTATVPDDQYELYVVATMIDGSKVLSPAQTIQTANKVPRIVIQTPQESLTTNVVPISIRVVSGEVSRITASVCDESGRELTAQELDVLQGAADGLISAEDWMDGSYSLVVSGRDDVTGRAVSVRQSFVLERASQTVSFTLPSEHLKGIAPVFWEWGDDEASLLPPIALQYSPDAGVHWVVVDSGDLASPYAWDTRDVPDSVQGRLRIVALGESTIISAEQPVRVNNVNSAPAVALSSPYADDVVGSECLVSWQAYDVDGDQLSARVEYRMVGDEWRIISEQNVNLGRFAWFTNYLAPGDYQLRVKVFDAQGAVGEDTVFPVTVSGNSSPVVRLNAPLEGMALEDDAIVLWNTYDADDDELSISIEYSYDAGKTWLPLADDLPNTGYYLWQFSFLPPGDRYRLRVIADDGQSTGADETVGLLTIGSPASSGYELLWPQDGTSQDGRVFLCWRTPRISTSSSVSLMVKKAGEEYWQPIAEDCGRSCFEVWDATGLSGEYQIVLGIFGRSSGRYELLEVLDQVHVNVGLLPVRHSVKLLSPSPGELVPGSVNVLWEAIGFSSDAMADIYLWTDSLPDWRLLTSVPAADGQYFVDQEALSGTRLGMIRVVVDDGSVSYFGMMEGVFVVLGDGLCPPSLQIISPDSNGLIRGNRLMWIASDTDEHDVSVSLEQSHDNGVTWELVEEGLSASDSYDISGLALGNRSRYRLTASDGVMSVSWVSSVIDAGEWPYVRIESPDIGDRLGGLVLVRWSYSDYSDPTTVDIQLSRDGLVWEPVARQVPNEGSYLLDLGEYASGWYWLRIVASGNSPALATTGPFEVTSMSLHMPLVSLSLSSNDLPLSGLERVTWHVIDQDGDSVSIALAYSLDQGSSWTTFATSNESEDGVLWDTRALPNTDQLWLRVMASDGRYTANDYIGPVRVSNGDYPSASFLTPSAGVWTGVQRISWRGSSETETAPRVLLDISTDGGTSWKLLSEDKNLVDSYVWDSNSVQAGTHVLFRIRVESLGQITAMAHSREIVVWGNQTLEYVLE